jgi:hypothetical protein
VRDSGFELVHQARLARARLANSPPPSQMIDWPLLPRQRLRGHDEPNDAEHLESQCDRPGSVVLVACRYDALDGASS